jgi:hypothetical protein
MICDKYRGKNTGLQCVNIGHGHSNFQPILNQHITIQSYIPVPVVQLIYICMSKKISISFYPHILLQYLCSLNTMQLFTFPLGL